LFILPACDSGGSSGGGGGGEDDGSSVVGVDDPNASNSFKMNITSSSSSSGALSKAVGKTYGGYAFQWSGTIPNTNKDFYVLFFTSKNPSNFDENSVDAELFGLIVSDQFSSPPPTETYDFGRASDNDRDFFGLIGEDFDTDDTGTRTIQLLESGQIVIDNSGSLTVTDFKNVSGQQYTIDLPYETRDDLTTEDNVSVTLDGSIEPGSASKFAGPGFSFGLNF
jgi:hypothetical protein